MRADRALVSSLTKSAFFGQKDVSPIAAGISTPAPSAQVGRPASAQLLYLYRWPDLRNVDSAQQVICARICALLAFRPSVEFLVGPRIGIANEEVAPILSSLRDLGAIGPTAANSDYVEAVEDDFVELKENLGKEPPRNTLWGKFLNRLRW
ncbi:MAG TPA: hypothetical protein VF472_19780 [Burkholderiaceae bacterium]